MFRKRAHFDLNPEILPISHLNFDNKIGSGAFGTVYRLPGSTPAKVLKCYHLNVNTWEERRNLLAKFNKECEAFDGIRHEHIVRYYGMMNEMRKDGQTIYGLYLEDCSRGSLENVIFNQELQYTMCTFNGWAIQLFSALEYLEEMQRIHRDIKTSNVLVNEEYRLKLGDFGEILFAAATHTGTYTGTERFMSPEVWMMNGERSKFSFKSDIYGVGLVLWEIMERKKVFADYFKGADLDVFDVDRLRNDFKNGGTQPLTFAGFPDFAQKVVEGCTRYNYQDRLSAADCISICEAEEQNLIKAGDVIFRPTEASIFVKPNGQQVEQSEALFNLEELHVEIGEDNDQSNEIKENEIELNVEYFQLNHPLLNKLFQHSSQLGAYFLENPDLNSETVKEASQILENLSSEWIVVGQTFLQKLAKGLDELQGLEREAEAEEIEKPQKTLTELITKAYTMAITGQKILYLSIFRLMFHFKKHSFSELSLSFFVNHFSEILDEQKNRFTKRFWMRGYFLPSIKEEWLFVEEISPNRFIFIRRDFSDIEEFCGRMKDWTEEVPSGDQVQDKSDENEFLFMQLHPLDLENLVDSLFKLMIKDERASNLYAKDSYPINEQPKEGFSKRNGLHLPVPGYIFHINNPPRNVCKCKTMCDRLENRFPYWSYHESKWQLCACSSLTEQNYSTLFGFFEAFIALCQFHPDSFLNQILLQRAIVKAIEEQEIDCPTEFLFYKLVKAIDGDLTLLLQYPNYDGARVLCMNEKFQVFKQKVYLNEIDQENLHEIDLLEALKDEHLGAEKFAEFYKDFLETEENDAGGSDGSSSEQSNEN